MITPLSSITLTNTAIGPYDIYCCSTALTGCTSSAKQQVAYTQDTVVHQHQFNFLLYGLSSLLVRGQSHNGMDI